MHWNKVAHTSPRARVSPRELDRCHSHRGTYAVKMKCSRVHRVA